MSDTSLAPRAVRPRAGARSRALRDERLTIDEVRGERLLRSRLAFSPDEAALVLGVGRDIIFDLIRRGELRARKAGSRTLIGRQQILDFLAGRDDSA
jgi:excisionase family DNA binding protein